MRELWHFTAEWCRFCKEMKPLIEEYLTANPNVEYIKIDIDEDKDAADQNRVEAVPTFVFFNKGNMVNRIDGAFDVEKIESLFLSKQA